MKPQKKRVLPEKSKIITRRSGRGKHLIEGTTVVTSEGVIITLLGGDRPHVGAVALAVPRPSLRDSSKTSSTSSVLTLVGHKDDVLARENAEKVAKNIKMPVVITAGVHVDEASDEDLKILTDNSRVLIEKLIDEIQKALEETV